MMALAFVGAIVSASAARGDTFQLSASTTYSFDGSASTTISQSTPNDAQPRVSESLGSKNSSQNGKASSQLGTQFLTFGARSQGDGNYSDASTAFYGQTFIASAHGRYTFNFTLTGGDLNTFASTSTTAGLQTASLSGLITETVNGGPAQTLFNYNASLSATGRDVPVFQESGARLNPSGATLAAGSGDYRFLLYTGSIDLGVLSQGEKVQIAYTLGTAASGTATACGGARFARPFVVVGPGDVLGCAGASAGNLDPAGVGGPIPTVTFTPTSVPEPGGLAVLGLGAASTLAAARAWGRRSARG